MKCFTCCSLSFYSNLNLSLSVCFKNDVYWSWSIYSMQPRNAYVGLYLRHIMYGIIVHNQHSERRNILKSLGLSFNLVIWGFSVMYPIESRCTCYPILSWAGGRDHIPSFLSQVLLCFALRWWLLPPLALSFLSIKDGGKWILISTLCCRTVKYLISIKEISKWSFWFIEHILHV